MQPNLRKTLQILAVSILSLLILLGLLFALIFTGVFGPLPEQAELKSIKKEQATLVLASDGNILGKFFAENRTNISIDEIPDHLLQALIATEDKRFYQHKGYDVRSYFRVFFKSILLGDQSAGGGSTITQQLVKNLYGRKYHGFLSMPINKAKEAIIATRMEDTYSKEEILVLYLNSVPFGEEVFGIEAASIRYFNKRARDLTVEESAVLVGILKANTYYNPRLYPENAIARRNQILSLMQQESFLNLKEADSLKKLPLNLSYTNYQLFSPAAYFLPQLKKKLQHLLETDPHLSSSNYKLEKDGLKIYTTLNYDLQRIAKEAAAKQLSKMQKLLDNELKSRGRRAKWEAELANQYSLEELVEVERREIFDWDGIKTEEMSLSDSLWHYYKMLHAAVLITEPSSGKVLAWVGGNNHRYLPFDMIYAERQLASVIKPFIYAAAIESGLNPCSYLENEVKEYEAYQNWKPENYNHQETKDSTVAFWYALANSMNLPTVDLYFKTGHEKVADVLRRMHIKVPIHETPSLALGTADASLYQLTKAYASIANGGVYLDELQLIDSICDTEGNTIYRSESAVGQEVLASEVCSQITEVLQIAINQGTGAQIRWRFGFDADLAGKTGTAQNYSNAWFMSYNPNLVIGTWVGARSPEMHFQSGLGSGSALALPISGDIWSKLETTRSLNQQYITPFSNDSTLLSLIDCPAYKEKGLDGFIHRLFSSDDEILQNDTSSELSRQEKREARKEERKNKREKKEKTKVGKFFERIFKGKDKNDDQ